LFAGPLPRGYVRRGRWEKLFKSTANKG